MPLNLTAEIRRQSLQNVFLIYPSCGNPLILNKTTNTFLQFWRELTMPHPLLCVSFSNPPFFKSNRCRLQIGLEEIIRNLCQHHAPPNRVTVIKKCKLCEGKTTTRLMNEDNCLCMLQMPLNMAKANYVYLHLAHEM